MVYYRTRIKNLEYEKKKKTNKIQICEDVSLAGNSCDDICASSSLFFPFFNVMM